MYWKLQHFDQALTRWIDTDVGRGSSPHEFKGKSEAFDYYFGKHGEKRNQDVRYRLAPVFSTQPVEIRQHKQTVRLRWVLDEYGTHPIDDWCCSNCGCSNSKRSNLLGH